MPDELSLIRESREVYKRRNAELLKERVKLWEAMAHAAEVLGAFPMCRQDHIEAWERLVKLLPPHLRPAKGAK